MYLLYIIVGKLILDPLKKYTYLRLQIISKIKLNFNRHF